MKKPKSDRGLELPSPPMYPILEMESIKGDISQDKSELPELPELPPLHEIEKPQEKRSGKVPKIPKYEELSASQLPKSPATPLAKKPIARPIPAPKGMQPSLSIPPIVPSSPRPMGLSRPITQEVGEDHPISYPKISHISRPRLPKHRYTSPIYVKIEKFKDALENFESIKDKLSELTSLLKDINDTRMKEQEEIETWEQEIEEIKNKIQAIDDMLFSKIGED